MCTGTHTHIPAHEVNPTNRRKSTDINYGQSKARFLWATGSHPRALSPEGGVQETVLSQFPFYKEKPAGWRVLHTNKRGYRARPGSWESLFWNNQYTGTHVQRMTKKESLLNNAFSGITKTGISAAEICQCDSLWKRPCPSLGEHNLWSKHVSWFATATRVTHSLSHCRIPCVLSQCHKEPKAARWMKLPLCLQIDIPSLRMKTSG